MPILQLPQKILHLNFRLIMSERSQEYHQVVSLSVNFSAGIVGLCKSCVKKLKIEVNRIARKMYKVPPSQLNFFLILEILLVRNTKICNFEGSVIKNGNYASCYDSFLCCFGSIVMLLAILFHGKK